MDNNKLQNRLDKHIVLVNTNVIKIPFSELSNYTKDNGSIYSTFEAKLASLLLDPFIKGCTIESYSKYIKSISTRKNLVECLDLFMEAQVYNIKARYDYLYPSAHSKLGDVDVSNFLKYLDHVDKDDPFSTPRSILSEGLFYELKGLLKKYIVGNRYKEIVDLMLSFISKINDLYNKDKNLVKYLAKKNF